MELSAYLRREGLRKARFAEMIGVPPSAVTHYTKGQRRPSWPTMRRIIEVTGGEVMPNDFLPAGEAAE